MLLTVYLLFIGLHVSEGCTLENSALLTITAHTGGSVLLPCSCTDLQTKPESFTWWKHNRNNQEEISRESEPPPSLPFIPFALVTVILLHIIVAVVYYTSRTKRLHSGEQYTTTTTQTTTAYHSTYRRVLPGFTTTLLMEMEWSVWIRAGCTLENSKQQLQDKQPLRITAHTGGSVLLPCSCPDLQTKPDELRWRRPKGGKWVEMSFNSDQYRNRVQLVNDHSPGNLSLLISHLTEEDGGDYQCAVKDVHIYIRLTLE
ncbi:hypothetical protein NFI96_022812, partial [Prochilodus magdalenae]